MTVQEQDQLKRTKAAAALESLNYDGPFDGPAFDRRMEIITPHLAVVEEQRTYTDANDQPFTRPESVVRVVDKNGQPRTLPSSSGQPTPFPIERLITELLSTHPPL